MIAAARKSTNGRDARPAGVPEVMDAAPAEP